MTPIDWLDIERLIFVAVTNRRPLAYYEELYIKRARAEQPVEYRRRYKLVTAAVRKDKRWSDVPDRDTVAS